MTESGPPATDPAADPADPGPDPAPADDRPSDDGSPGEDAPAEHEPQPDWWHRSHPTFAGLVGFFTGVAYVIVVPGIYAALLSLVFSDRTAQRLFPLVAVILVVPLVMLIPRKTRRFAQFMLLGAVGTALVIGLTAALVIWVLVQLDG
jgi:hypothetical protein